MFIKVTNASPERAGDPILLNINSILSVYENHEESGSLSTVIFSTNGLTWVIEESIEKVHSLIKAQK